MYNEKDGKEKRYGVKNDTMLSQNHEIQEQEVLDALDNDIWKLSLDIVEEIARNKKIDSSRIFCNTVYTHLEALVDQGDAQQRLVESTESLRQGVETKIYYYRLTGQGLTRRYNK